MREAFADAAIKMAETAENTETFFDRLESMVETAAPEAALTAQLVKAFWDGLENESVVLQTEVRGKADDNGSRYMEDGKLLPNTTYVLNGNRYRTDDKGRIIHCESNPQRTPENPRDPKAQTQAGGSDRKPGDQGGHIIGRDISGDGGSGNLVPMDSRINESDYKRMEMDVKRSIDEGKEVTTSTEITYSEDSERPDMISTTVTVDGKETTYTFDNNLDGSLLDKLEVTCSESDMANIQGVLDENGGQVSSMKEERDENGNLEKTTVSVTYTGEDGKNYRTRVVIDHDGGDLS